MIKYNNKEISQIYKSKKVITYVFKGIRLVWEGIKSCFSGGIWYQEKKWLNEAKWKDKK